MIDFIRERVRTREEHDKKYLVFPNIDKKYKHYQLDIINGRKKDGVLPLEVRETTDYVEFYYDVTSMVQLKDFLKHKKINKGEFVKIVCSILDCVCRFQEIGLNAEALFLDAEHMYLDKDSLEVFIAYLPITVEQEVSDNVKSFMINFVLYVSKIEHSDKNSYFLNKILDLLNDVDFEYENFYNCVLELGEEQSTKKQISNREDNNEDNIEDGVNICENEVESLGESTFMKTNVVEVDEVDSMNELLLEDSSEQSSSISITSNFEEVASGKDIGDIKENIGSSEEKVKKNSIRDKISSFDLSGSVFLGVIIQSSMIIVVLTLYFVMDSVIGKVMPLLVGVLLLASVIMWAIVIHRTKKSKKSELENGRIFESQNKKHKSWTDIETGETRKISQTFLEDLYSEKNKISIENDESMEREYQLRVSTEGMYVAQESNNASAMVTGTGIYNDETVVVMEDTKTAFLKYEEDGNERKIRITKDSFLIGRMRGKVDYVVTYNAIGRMHLEVIQRNNDYYIKDLNTRNGTYLNGSKLSSDVEYKILDNDVINLANKKFKFCIEN